MDKRDTIPASYDDMKIIEEQFEDYYSQIIRNESQLPSHLSIDNSIMNFDIDNRAISIEVNPFQESKSIQIQEISI